ncbi:MAG: hypothetical protein ACM65M_10605 [Microcoleus sp.]
MPTPRKPSKAPTSQDLLLPPEEPSLLYAQRELIRTNGIDFEQWWDEFKVGFVNGNRDKATNYKTSLWTKPKYSNITPTTSTSGAVTIEYWPDKDKLEDSYLLSGTTSDLIGGIMAIMRQKSTEANSVSGKGSKPLLRGYPCIKLLFMSDDGIKGVKQIRCVGFTENSKIAASNGGIKLLTTAEVGKWSNRIKTIFGDKEFAWNKGISCLSYSGMIARLQGLEGYAYVKSKADGIILFTAMLEIFGTKPDMDGFNFSEKINTSQFTKGQEETRLILNQKVKISDKRPIANCKFVSASLVLDGLKKPIPLVRGKVAFNLSDVVLSA